MREVKSLEISDNAAESILRYEYGGGRLTPYFRKADLCPMVEDPRIIIP